MQVVQSSVPLRRAGARYVGLCPFHAEKTPSFNVHPDKGFFHCFGCGVGGDVLKFVELQERLGFQDAVRHLAQRVGMRVPEPATDRDAAAEAEREALVGIHDDRGGVLLRAPGGAGGRGGEGPPRGPRHHPGHRAAAGAGIRPACPRPPDRAPARTGLRGRSPRARRAGRLPRRGAARGPVPEPARHSHRPGQRNRRRVRGAGPPPRTAGEVPELAGDRHLLEGAHPVRAAPLEARHPRGGVRDSRRGVLRSGAGGPGGGGPRRRLLRHRPGRAAGPVAQALRVEGGRELRPPIRPGRGRRSGPASC